MSGHFGEHLTIDGYGGDKNLLNNQEVVLGFLSDLPQQLGMHTLINPQVAHTDGNNEKDPGGWSGFVVIMESHISIHTFPDRGFVSADVYTCQNGLDTEKVQQYITDTFKLQKLETNFIIRGKEYPQENIY